MLLGRQALLLLKLKVAECTCEIEVTINAAVSHHAASCLDASDLLLVLRFVIKTQRDDIAAFSEDASGVSCVGDVKFRLVIVNHNHVCCTADRVKL